MLSVFTMYSSRLYLVHFFIILKLCTINGDGIIKSSLAFIIDDTGSMWNEIDQVKRETNNIFDTVLGSPSSQIENFILVTFNDPDASVMTVTKSRYDFKNALARINVHGGGDCPEYAMKGIELALQESLPSSYLYVFTDASAKDYARFEHIKNLAMKKQSQVVFVLTGKCGDESSADYQVYHRVAEATSGMVFNMMKDNVKDILTYVKETITNKVNIVANKNLLPGYGYTVPYYVDSCASPTLIVATGYYPKIEAVTGPGGTRPEINLIINIERVAVAKVTCVSPGDHYVRIGSSSATHVMISGKTHFDFQLGFSAYKPSSIADAVSRPPATGNAFLSIKLNGDGVKFNASKILDMAGNVITELTLSLVDAKEKFYVSPLFNPPNTMFRVSIFGYEIKTGTLITRSSPTAIERQPSTTTEPVKNIIPQVTIEGRPKIITKYDDPLELKCKVHGYPKPVITWAETGTGKVLPTTESVIELPYDYISILNIEKANKNTTYECKANNAYGKYIYVETTRKTEPVSIDVPKESKIVTKVGTDVILSCRAKGYPTPEVTWTFEGIDPKTTSTRVTSLDASMSVNLQKVQLTQQGHYTCVASNVISGSAKITYDLSVYVPVSIDIPKSAKIEIIVGNDIVLPCRADGYPMPDIKWTFQSFDSKLTLEDVTSLDASKSVKLQNVQLKQQGYYTCVASNVISGSATIKYEIYVHAEPVIKTVYSRNILQAIEGDSVLRIECKATGNPTPTITWQKDGTDIDFGSEDFKMEVDGTLQIKNINLKSQGMYTCLATNKVGNDAMVYEVIVNEFPKPETPVSKVTVIEGETVDLKCDVPHKDTDSVRWYKNGVVIAIGDLRIVNITSSQKGLYTCRVCDLSITQTITTEVEVEFKPVFHHVVTNTIELIRHNKVELDCFATGLPDPKITWKHNDKEIAITNMIYAFQMTLESRGIYTCEVSNKLGSIQRTFDITSRDCILNITKDFPEKQPIMISSTLTWPTYEVVDGYMVIPFDDYFFLDCPSYFLNKRRKHMKTYCKGETKVKFAGKIYEFSDIKCKEEAGPQIIKTEHTCLPGNTEYIDVGYTVFNEFLKAYEVCFDKSKNLPLFTINKISKHNSNSTSESKWFSSGLLPVDFNAMYDCHNQAKDLPTHSSCCFTKRQLVNAKDLRPGIPASASFYSLNVIPHWSSCNTKNWEDVENKVRDLAARSDLGLKIYTGVVFDDALSPGINLRNGLGGHQPVPQYLWKVVQDPKSSASLAIIQVNVPDLSPMDAFAHVRCRDICHSIAWMQSTNWHNVKDGFTFCCTVAAFEKEFEITGIFGPGKHPILYDLI